MISNNIVGYESFRIVKYQKKCKKIIHLQPNFFEIIKNFNSSAYGQIYSLGFKMWKDHPWQGIGLNNFTYLCNNDQRYHNLIIFLQSVQYDEE